MTLADAMSLEAKAKDTKKFEDALQRVTGIRVSAPPQAIIGATPSLARASDPQYNLFNFQPRLAFIDLQRESPQ